MVSRIEMKALGILIPETISGRLLSNFGQSGRYCGDRLAQAWMCVSQNAYSAAGVITLAAKL